MNLRFDRRWNFKDMSLTTLGFTRLDVDNLSAEINLAAEVASIVTINAGVQVGIEKVNITISDVEAELELIIRLGNCKFKHITPPPLQLRPRSDSFPPLSRKIVVDIVNRTLSSLDLNPTLINLLNTITDVVTEVVGAVDGLLGSITSGDSTLNYIVDNLGNIVQEVVGDAGSTVSTIVGNYLNNMTLVGDVESLAGGLVQKTYSYAPLNALVDIVFNALGQVVQATVVKSTSGSTSTTAVTSATSATTAPASTTASATAAAAARRK